MRLLFVVVLCFGSLYAEAQATWQGLSFGMKRQQVRDTLSARGFSLRGSDEAATSTVEPDFELKTTSATLSANLKPAIATAPTFFTPELSFDAQGRLQAIKLNLDQAKVLQSTPGLSLQTLPVLTYIAGTSVYEQLTAKYGVPVTRRGPCNNINLASLVGTVEECSAKWSDTSQTIELFWAWSGLIGRPDRLSFFVLYSSAGTSGL